MSETTRNAGWRDKINLGFVSLVFVLLPILAYAGGLGIAPAAAIAGGVGFVTVARPQLRAIPKWGYALAAFLIWATVSSLWSPYQDTQTLTNPVKILIGVPIFFAFDRAVKSASTLAPNGLRRLVIGVFILGVGMLLVDMFTSHGLTYLFDPLPEGDTLKRRNIEIMMNLGHSVVVMSLCLSFVLAMIKLRGGVQKIICAMLIFAMLFSAYKHGTAVVLIAVVFSILVMGLAARWPKATLKGMAGLSVFTVLGAPLFGLVSRLMDADMKAAMPFSWEHRVEMWDYVLSKVYEAPLIGHGFDAVRTFDGTFNTRGFENLDIVPLHPHNAGLHIWAETGLIGAALASITLFLMGRAAIRGLAIYPERTVALCGFAAAAIIICTVTYGVWQDWWWAALIVVGSTRHLIPARQI